MVNRLTINHTDNQIQLLWQQGNNIPRYTESVIFTHPFDTEALSKIRWYLEEYLSFPYGIEPEKASNLEHQLQEWGKELYNLVFRSSEKGRQFFQEATREGLNQCELIIASENPKVLNLPWELLYCEDYQFLAPNLAGIYRSLGSFAIRAEMKPLSQDKLNILLVIARPYGERDINFKTIAKPLLEALKPIANRVNLRVLRPPSFEQLERELNANKGFYHIVHFDGHGSFDENSRGFQHSFGEFGQGVLVFEDSDGNPQIVTAAQIAQSLTDCNVPLFVLNACQSAQEGNGSFSSVATRLVTLGAKGVVAMAYSVYAVAAKYFIGRLYEQLVMGASVDEAVAAGRRELLNKSLRPSRKGDLRLQDWFVPVLYQQEDYTPFISISDNIADLEAFLEETDPIPLVDFPEEGQYGFIGRDYDILRLERAFRHHHFVLLQGVAGVGKTELACGFARWLKETQGRERLYFASFEQGRGISQVIYQVGRSVWGGGFSQHSEENQEKAVIKYLKQTPCLLIWDNFESVAGFPEGNEALCTDEERQAFTRFLKGLRGGKTWVLMTSRQGEDWLGIDYQLLGVTGLAKPDAEELGDKILDTVGVNRKQLPPEYLDLFDLLGGHPLSLRVVLPHLKTQSPSDLIEALRRGLDTFVGKSEEGRDKSLLVSLDYSFSTLSSRTRRHLPFLSLFSTRVYAYWFKILFNKSHSDVSNVYKSVFGHNLKVNGKVNEWDKILNEAVQAGLLENLGNNIYKIHPTLPWYLRRELEKFSNEKAIQELEKMLILFYTALAENYEQLLISDDKTAITMINIIEPNLLHNLNLAEINENWLAAQTILRVLGNLFQRQGRRKKFINLRKRALKRVGTDINDLKKKGVEALSYWTYIKNNEAHEKLDLDTTQILEAQSIYQNILNITLSVPEPLQDNIARLNNNLGNTFIKLRDYEKAQYHYEYALKIREATKDDHGHGIASCYSNLGELARNRRNFEDAIKYYKKALRIFKDLKDNSQIAVIYFQMGMIYENMREFQKSLVYLNKALEIYLKPVTGDLSNAAYVYHLLGNVFYGQNQYKLAEKNYKQAMKIYEDLEEWNKVADEYLQLGSVAQEQNRFDDALLYYKKAELNNQKYYNWTRAGAIYHQLGLLFQKQMLFDEAILNFSEALQIYQENNDEYHAADDYQALAMIYQEKQNYQESISYSRKALKIYQEKQDWYKFAITSYVLGKVLGIQGNAEAMQVLIQGFLIDLEHHKAFLDMYIDMFQSLLQDIGESQFSVIWKEVTGTEFVGEIRDLIMRKNF